MLRREERLRLRNRVEEKRDEGKDLKALFEPVMEALP
jgi:hypothetical protein